MNLPLQATALVGEVQAHDPITSLIAATSGEDAIDCVAVAGLALGLMFSDEILASAIKDFRREVSLTV